MLVGRSLELKAVPTTSSEVVSCNLNKEVNNSPKLPIAEILSEQAKSCVKIIADQRVDVIRTMSRLAVVIYACDETWRGTGNSEYTVANNVAGTSCSSYDLLS